MVRGTGVGGNRTDGEKGYKKRFLFLFTVQRPLPQLVADILIALVTIMVRIKCKEFSFKNHSQPSFFKSYIIYTVVSRYYNTAGIRKKYHNYPAKKI